MVGIDAVRPAAVRDVFLVFRKQPEATLEFVDRDGNRAGNMPGDVFARGPRIEHYYLVRSCASQQFLHTDSLGVRSIPKMIANQPIELGQAVLGHRTNGL